MDSPSVIGCARDTGEKRVQEVCVIARKMSWLWATSAAVCPGSGLAVAGRRVKFITRALAIYDAIAPFMSAPQASALGRLMERRPHTVGAVTWPYQCLGWDARTRLARIRDHYEVVDSMQGPINFDVGCMLLLLDLKNIYRGLQVVIDHPMWFMREGQITINLFIDKTRIYSLVFSLFSEADGNGAFVGAIQGRDLEGILDQYRDLTKACHGMRPRDLLIEVFRMFCAHLGMNQILAVSDAYRQSRSDYYGQKRMKVSLINYDEVWRERGGTLVDPMFYSLKVENNFRDLDTVPTKKRALYRRRYDMLTSFKEGIRESYNQPTIVPASL
jgi:uncharacterized protein VirK/YbjX